MKRRYPGMLLSLCGGEGSGKSTAAVHLFESLKEVYPDRVVLTREPGGTRIGGLIRSILLSNDSHDLCFEAEALLFAADRAQHVRTLIEPALREGKIVISDRYADSTLAYQHYGRGIDLALIKDVIRLGTCGIMPDLTLLFDVDVETGLKRAKGRGDMNRLDQAAIDFHRAVRRGFLQIARENPGRVRIIDATQSQEKVLEYALKTVNFILSNLACA